MKVLLRSDVDGVGKRGDLVEVADGHARNYLIPKGLATRATAGVDQQASAMRKARDVRDAADRSAAQEVATRLVPTVITVAAKAGPEGKLYGSVTAADIAEAISAQAGIELDRRALQLDEPIKVTGTHSVSAKLHPEVEFPVTVDVVPT